MHDAPVSGRLPVFPWDTLDAAKTTAAAHRGGLIDLSIGTPIDPSPALAQDALTAAADAPGSPTVQGRGGLVCAPFRRDGCEPGVCCSDDRFEGTDCSFACPAGARPREHDRLP